MYIEKERRKEIYDYYHGKVPWFDDEVDFDDESTEALADWEDWHFMELADRMLEDILVDGKLPQAEVEWLKNCEDIDFSTIKEEDYGWHWSIEKAGELQDASDAEFMEWFREQYPEYQSTGDDLGIEENLRKNLARLDEMDDLSQWRGKPEVLKQYKDLQEKHKDDPYIFAFLQRCIDNGGGNPEGLEEDLQDEEFLKGIKHLVDSW